MNKQEVIKCINDKKIPGCTITYEDERYNEGLITALSYIEQIDEPEKPVVPQFVADWYEDNKRDFENQIYTLCISFYDDALSEELYHWFVNSENEPIQTLVRMKLYGYEVEKEKLYTVKFANEDFGKMYIGIFKKFNKLGISSLPLNDDEVKSWFTEDELKRFKFWDNPAFEVDEVKK